MAIPATDNPRYQLATLAGTDLSDATVRVGNRRLWNGYQRVLLGDQFRSDNSHMAVLPELSEDDLDRITAIEGLEALIVTPDARVKIDFPGVEFPDVTFQGFLLWVWCAVRQCDVWGRGGVYRRPANQQSRAYVF